MEYINWIEFTKDEEKNLKEGQDYLVIFDMFGDGSKQTALCFYNSKYKTFEIYHDIAGFEINLDMVSFYVPVIVPTNK